MRLHFSFSILTLQYKVLFIMEKHEEQLKAIQEMRNLMDQASRFKSISGLAGILAGILSFSSVALAHGLTGISPLEAHALDRIWQSENQYTIAMIFLGLFILCISIGIYLSKRNARQAGKIAWANAAKRLTWSLAIPVLAGGIFALLLIRMGLVELAAPVTLLFYGMGLLSSSKYTLDAVRTVGLLFMLLGLIATIFLEYGLLIWTAGFGLVHVAYGFIIYVQNERV